MAVPSVWLWVGLVEEERVERWQQFAAWVEWLEQAYSPWIVLPPCWARHEGLCAELRVFWYWHIYAMTTANDPVGAVRWHQDLRRSAEAWRELSTCTHEPPLRQQKAIMTQRRAQVAAFVADATRAEAGPE